MDTKNNIPTHELVKELMSREGVQSVYVEPYQNYQVMAKGDIVIDETGSAFILVVID